MPQIRRPSHVAPGAEVLDVQIAHGAEPSARGVLGGSAPPDLAHR